MPNFITKIRKFITKDVKNESESKDLAVLIRFLSISTTLFVLLSSIYLALIGVYFFAIISIPLLGAYVIIFVNTYENKTQLSFNLFIYVSLVYSAVFTLANGWDKNYQWIILIVALVVFFSMENDFKYKFNQMEIILIVFIAISILSHIFGPYKVGGSIQNTFWAISSTVYYAVSVSYIAYSYSSKFNESEVKLHKYNQKLQQMASLDALTQLCNRRSMNDYMSQIAFEKDKKGDVFCIAIADLDFFKKVNDVYGHEAGDFILKEVAKIFEKTMEGRGKVARWGGEEFLFCFEDLNLEQSRKILDEMRQQIEIRKFIYKDSEIVITITIGLEEYYHINGIEGTISRADQKLYDGKKSGRNRVVV